MSQSAVLPAATFVLGQDVGQDDLVASFVCTPHVSGGGFCHQLSCMCRMICCRSIEYWLARKLFSNPAWPRQLIRKRAQER